MQKYAVYCMLFSSRTFADTTLIDELPFPLFRRTESIFRELWFDEVFIQAAFEGKNPARVFVDDADHPTAALMCRSYDFFVAGNTETPLNEFIKAAPAEVFQPFYGFAVGDPWKDTLLQLHPQLEIIPRVNYRWEGGTVINWRDALPTGVEIYPFDAALAARAEKEFPFAQIFWGSTEAFLQHGFGFCLLEQGEVASIVYACAVSDTEASVGVDTMEKYQQRGYATLVCSAFVEHCLLHNLLPTWDADGFNAASIKLAQKLGLVEKRPFYELAMPHRQPLNERK